MSAARSRGSCLAVLDGPQRKAVVLIENGSSPSDSFDFFRPYANPVPFIALIGKGGRKEILLMRATTKVDGHVKVLFKRMNGSRLYRDKL